MTPEVVRPRQTVTATVTTDKPIDKVSVGDPGVGLHQLLPLPLGRARGFGGHRDERRVVDDGRGRHRRGQREGHRGLGRCDEGRSAGRPDGEFTGGSSSFTVPSWAPGSSEASRAVVGPADGRARRPRRRHPRRFHASSSAATISRLTDEPQRRTGGDGETDMDIVLPSTVFRAGETINGSITLTPNVDMSDGELVIHWGYERHLTSPRPHTGGRRRREGRADRSSWAREFRCATAHR